MAKYKLARSGQPRSASSKPAKPARKAKLPTAAYKLSGAALKAARQFQGLKVARSKSSLPPERVEAIRRAVEAYFKVVIK